MAWRHKDILEAELHEAKGFTTANNGDSLWRNENGNSEWIDREVLPSALNFVDGSSAPPTASTGDIYVLSTITTTLDPLWGVSPILNDWVRYDGTEWQLITPSKSIMCYDKTLDVLMSYNGSTWASVGTDTNIANTNLTQTDPFRKYTLSATDPSYLEFQAGSGSDAIRLTDGLDLLMQNNTSDPVTSYLTKMNNLGIQFGSGNWTIRHNGVSQFYIEGASPYNGRIQLGTGVILKAPDANRAVQIGGHFIKFQDRTLGVEHARFDQNGKFMFNATALIGAEGFLVADDMLVKGSDTSLSTTGFKFTDSADVNLFEIRNNGDIYTETLQGLNVTLDPTAITSMTFTNGILTAQS